MRAVVVEDNALLRDGLTRILEAHGWSVTALPDASGLGEQLAGADVAVLDVRLPPTHTTEGLVAAVGLRRDRPGFPVLVLSQWVEQLYARELMASGDGAMGYLLKDRVADVRSFVAAVHQVADGGTVLDPQVVSAVLAAADRRSAIDVLTPREREVLELMAQGRSNAAIAGLLVVTEKAVGKHINNIFSKLGLPVDAEDNRRVLAVLRWLQARG
ncbi:response regulator transcription factor [Modestobacter sp. NPDC049651]|uniref:response regulator transcription factor n=1 Tax=unclassified Modestobacter TaxID=2643866 RepID=UPI0033FB9147